MAALDITPGRYAVIDIGTVTCRMLVADISVNKVASVCVGDSTMCSGRPVSAVGASIAAVAKEYKITNLGEGVDATGMLSPAAIARVREALGCYIDKLGTLNTPQHPVIKTSVFATSASRDAKNAADFTAMMCDLGLDVQIISGKREAAMSYLGASMTSAKSHKDAGNLGEGEAANRIVAVVDIGGGSTEVSIGKTGEPPAFSHSFDIGCRRVTERFFNDDPPTQDQLATAEEWIASELARVLGSPDAREVLGALGADNMSDNKTDTRIEMIAVAGTATTAVTVRDSIGVYDSAQVNGATISLSDVESLLKKFRAASPEERRNIVGLDPGRAPVIIAGMLILKSVMTALGVSTFIASDNDILEGAALVAAGYSI